MKRLKLFRLALPAAMLAATCSPASAETDPGLPQVDVHLLAASVTPAPGAKLDLGIAIDPGPGWHIYWQNPGETGYAPRFSWTLPAGATIGAIHHPAPQRLVAAGSTVNVLGGPVVLLTTLALPDHLNAGDRLHVAGTADLLVCSDSMCVPQAVPFSRDLRVGSGEPASLDLAALTEAHSRLPQVWSAPVSFEVEGKDIRLDGVLPRPDAGEHVAVFAASPDDGLPGDVHGPASEGTVRFDRGTLRIDRPLDLVITYGREGKPPRHAVAVHAVSAPTAAASAPLVLAAWSIAGALFGGLLLNLMPCVFPILSLKAMALARAGGDRREARAEALGYLVGAVGVMVALGAMVLLLRAGGQATGWAFQIQDPRVVALLLLLVVAIATNLAGLYELPALPLASARRAGFAGGLGIGALAAFVATPCTGPFMAGALGAALVLPPMLALPVFASLGLGLALPFLAIGFFEPARRLLPKPGQWMVTLRQLLSLPMFATALGLAWLLGRLAGVSGMTTGLGLALLCGLALWWAGLRQHAGKRAWPGLALTLLAVLVAPLLHAGAAPAEQANAGLVQPYSPQRLAALRAAHRPVLVYATADWCLTCKVNESTSLSAHSVRDAFARAGAVMLEADWTRPDREVTQLLSEYGRAGVPLYVWFPPDGTPRVLAQVLTPGMVSGLLARS